MKFYKQMVRNMVSEWIPKYMDYRSLKHQIKVIKQNAIALADAFSQIQGNKLELILASKELKT